MPSSIDADALVATLQDLVQRAGADPLDALAFAEDRLRAAGLTDVTRVPNGERPALVARRPGAGPVLVVSGHVDVVPAADGWSVPPHEGRVVDGRVVGRGVADMLGSVACWLHLAEARPDLPLAVMLTTDEEIGMEGADALVAHADAFRDVAGIVVGEPSDFEIGVAEKGVLWMRLVATGRNAHASMPREGVNAADKLVAALARVRAVIPLEGAHPLLGAPTLSLGTLRAGSAVNVVPDHAVAELDHRFLPSVDPDTLLASIREAAAPDAEVEVLSLHPPFGGDAESPLAEAARAGVTAAGRDARVVGLPYGTEACKYAALAPTIILGPGERALAHTPDESLAVTDLVAGYRAFEALADAFAKA